MSEAIMIKLFKTSRLLSDAPLKSHTKAWFSLGSIQVPVILSPSPPPAFRKKQIKMSCLPRQYHHGDQALWRVGNGQLVIGYDKNFISKIDGDKTIVISLIDLIMLVYADAYSFF